MTSTLRVDRIGPSAGGTLRNLVRGVAAAWANLNGTGTIALRDSENISSVVDGGVGIYTFNFINAMDADDSALSGSCGVPGTANGFVIYGSAPGLSATSVQLGAFTGAAVFDASIMTITVHGDLA